MRKMWKSGKGPNKWSTIRLVLSDNKVVVGFYLGCDEFKNVFVLSRAHNPSLESERFYVNKDNVESGEVLKWRK